MPQDFPVGVNQSENNEQKKVCYLYHFVWRGTTYRLTNYDTKVTWNCEVYTPVAIAHTEMDDVDKSTTIIATLENGFLKEFFMTQPVAKLRIRVYRVLDSLPNPADTNIWLVYYGECTNVGFKNNQIAMSCVPVAIGSDGRCPNTFCSKFCNWKLYGVACKLDVANYTTSTVVSAVDLVAKTITIPNAEPAGEYNVNYWGLGTIVHNGSQYMILSSVPIDGGTLLTMADLPVEYSVGDSVQVLAGCNHTTIHCKYKLDNLANFGGHPYVPWKNPAVDGI